MVVHQRFGRYQVIRPLAAGGMAQVYLGRALGAGGFQRLVAIKVMHRNLARDPSFVAMFLDEGRIAAGIHHPNVVATLDVQQGPEGLYMVLDYIAGCSLHALLRKLRAESGRARLPLPVVIKLTLDVLAGLHAAHELLGPDGQALHVVHRDISPHNVLVGVDGLARITDFGIARAESRLARTAHGEVKGKLAYMSAQQLRGETVDRRCDVYAAGVVLWEMLAGERLFRAADRAELAFKVLEGTTEQPSSRNPDAPAELDAVCQRALAVDPAKRFPSAAGFADAITSAARKADIAVATTAEVGAFGRLAQVDVGPLPPLSAPWHPDEPARGRSDATPQSSTQATTSSAASTGDARPASAHAAPSAVPASPEATSAEVSSDEAPTVVRPMSPEARKLDDGPPATAEIGPVPGTQAPYAIARPTTRHSSSPPDAEATATRVSLTSAKSADDTGSSPTSTPAARRQRNGLVLLAALLLLLVAGWLVLSRLPSSTAKADAAASATASASATAVLPATTRLAASGAPAMRPSAAASATPSAAPQPHAPPSRRVGAAKPPGAIPRHTAPPRSTTPPRTPPRYRPPEP